MAKNQPSPIVRLFDLKYDLDECLADIHRGVDRIDTAIMRCNEMLDVLEKSVFSMPATSAVIEEMVRAILAGLQPPTATVPVIIPKEEE